MEQAIKTNHLTKTYKDLTAVDHIDFEIAHGTLFSLLGVNGAGKTTTIKMLSGLITPSDGDAYLYGKSIRTDPQAAKSILAVSPQETAVAPGLTVAENLTMMAGVHGFSKTIIREKIDTLSQQFGFQQILSKKAARLSGGWQRRLSIAMALICEPKLMFLDEPTLGLDVLARHELWEIVRALKGQITILLTTHYMEEAEALSDEIGIMKQGRLLCMGTAESLKAQTGESRFEDAFIRIVKEDAA